MKKIFLIFFGICLSVCLFFDYVKADEISNNFEIKVSQSGHAKAYLNNMAVITGIVEFFEFYTKNADNSRNRIDSGPWDGSKATITQIDANTFSLINNTSATGMRYNIEIKQTEQGKIDVKMLMISPNQASYFDTNYFYLSPDLFKGSNITSIIPSDPDDPNDPDDSVDPTEIPVTALSEANRIFFSSRTSTLLETLLGSVYITNGSPNIAAKFLGADFRNTPWASKKDIYFGRSESSSTLIPAGTSFELDFSLTLGDPTIAQGGVEDIISKFSEATGTIENKTDQWDFYNIEPKIETEREGNPFIFQNSEYVYANANFPDSDVDVLVKEFKARTNINLIDVSNQSEPQRGIILSLDNSLAENESFEIDVSENKILIKGKDPRGCLYGIYKMISMAEKNVEQWQVSAKYIKDYPDLAVRGQVIENISKNVSVDVLKRYIDAMSRARSNTLVWLHQPSQIRAWKTPGSYTTTSWSKAEIQEATAYARSLRMDVIGGMSSTYYTSSWPELTITTTPYVASLYDPYNANNYAIITGLYDEILNAYSPSTFLIAHDEIRGLDSYAAQYSKTSAEVLADDINTLKTYLDSKNITTAMWADMLLNYNTFYLAEHGASSNYPGYNSTNAFLAADLISKEIILYNWHYVQAIDYASIPYLQNKGFKIIGNPWYNPLAANSLAKNLVNYGSAGLLGTDWGMFATMSPASTTLYAQVSAWNNTITTMGDNTDIETLAETLKSDMQPNRYSQRPIDLSSYYNKITQGDNFGEGPFGWGSILDLRALPMGENNYASVDYNIASHNNELENNAILLKTGTGTQTADREKTINLGNIKTNGLTFLQTAFLNAPNYYYRNIGSLNFLYEDGSTGSLNLAEGYNVTDIRSTNGIRTNAWTFYEAPDVLAGSDLAWRGTTKTQTAINLQSLIWENPHPEKHLQSVTIKLNSSTINDSLLILGITSLEGDIISPVSPTGLSVI